MAESSITWQTQRSGRISKRKGIRTREGLEQDDIERPGQQLADLVDGGSGCIWETHGQVIPGTTAQQKADGSADRCAHCQAASGQVREAQELHSRAQQQVSENNLLADWSLCCVLRSAHDFWAGLSALA